MLKLYHGTFESAAKAAPMAGIRSADPLTLTTCYGAYQAFLACDPKKNERWAIIELFSSYLSECLESYPDPKLKGKRTWQKSLDMVGLCLHRGAIPSYAISKIWIFNTESNWFITRFVLHTKVGLESQRQSMEIINRWLTGEFVMIDEWFGEQKDKFTQEQKEQMANLWNERSGLDLFYHGPREGR